MKNLLRLFVFSIFIVTLPATSQAVCDQYKAIEIQTPIVAEKQATRLGNIFRKLRKSTNPSAEEPVGDPLASFALIAGVVSILGVIRLITLITAPVGIVLSIISLVRIKKHPDQWKGKNMATWGLVLNILGLGLAIGWLWYLVKYIFD
jgi:Domain of unknown function (DUF4190)